jgi:hypothetical protein
MGAVFGWALHPAQVEGSIHQSHMGEGLREIADHPPGQRVVLLSQQADVVAESQQTFKERSALLLTPLKNEVVGQPEAARQKRTLSRVSAVS